MLVLKSYKNWSQFEVGFCGVIWLSLHSDIYSSGERHLMAENDERRTLNFFISQYFTVFCGKQFFFFALVFETTSKSQMFNSHVICCRRICKWWRKFFFYIYLIWILWYHGEELLQYIVDAITWHSPNLQFSDLRLFWILYWLYSLFFVWQQTGVCLWYTVTCPYIVYYYYSTRQ